MSVAAKTVAARLPCPSCNRQFAVAELEPVLYTCPACRSYLKMPACARIASVADAGSFVEFNRRLTSRDPLRFHDTKPYWKRLATARKETGLSEAVVTGRCTIGGKRVVLIVFDFRFLGGSMGSVVGEKVARAFERATNRRVPVVCIAASGGARMQEGMLSLLQMAKVAAAVARHDRCRVGFISVLTDPTFGGVAASLSFLGDAIIAEAGAQIGFVGPRVLEQTSGVAPPSDSHHAETLLKAGLLDCVVGREQMRKTIALLVSHITQRKPLRRRLTPPASVVPDSALPAWEEVRLARDPARPTNMDYISAMMEQFIELHGDRASGDDPAIVGGFARFDGQSVVVIGHRRGKPHEEQQRYRDGLPMPEGYRKAMRLMRLAAKFQLPLITLIDTAGAQASFESERGGIAHALASSLALMTSLQTAVVSVVTGQGGSGGALAIGVGDRVLMMEHAVYSVLSPEGAASIVFRDAARAHEIAPELKLTSRDLLRLGVIDAIVPEPAGGAQCAPDQAAETLKQHIAFALAELGRQTTGDLLKQRHARLSEMGQIGSYWRAVLPFQYQAAIDAFTEQLFSGRQST